MCRIILFHKIYECCPLCIIAEKLLQTIYSDLVNAGNIIVKKYLSDRFIVIHVT